MNDKKPEIFKRILEDFRKDIKQGQSTKFLVEKYKISTSTLSNWKKRVGLTGFRLKLKGE